MAQVLCFTRPVSLSRKNGTLAVSQGEETPRLLPLLQISEIFALGLALTIGTFANLSLDPWCSLITEGHSFPLARDLAFLLEPCFVEAALSVRGGLPERIENCAESFQLRLKRPFARDRGRIWSLRTLPLREAYLLLGAIRGGGIYRPAWNVEVKDHEAVGSP